MVPGIIYSCTEADSTDLQFSLGNIAQSGTQNNLLEISFWNIRAF